MKLLVCISCILPLMLFGQSKVRLDESFDPTSLNDWPGTRERIEQIRSLKVHYASLGDDAATGEPEEYSAFVFRVQLASTSDYDEAIAIETRAASTFDEDIILHFDSPYYKIRVGKMNNREDAQALQQIAMENGFRRAWVIRTENAPEPQKN